jgi:cytoskeleton protein RodZ
VQVRQAGGEPLFTRLMAAGERYQVPDRAGLTLATGNAGGLRLTLDGQALAPLGESGEVKRNISLMPADLQPGAIRE